MDLPRHFKRVIAALEGLTVQLEYLDHLVLGLCIVAHLKNIGQLAILIQIIYKYYLSMITH